MAPMQVFAVVEAGGTQFKVTTDDVFFITGLHGLTDVNDVLELPGVLLLGPASEALRLARAPGALWPRRRNCRPRFGRRA